MAKRMVDTELWNDESIIENFTAEDRYFWLYLLTSPHNNICGVLKYSPSLMARDMGLHKDTIINLLYRFENVHHIIIVDKDTEEILITNWYKYNWTKSSDLLKTIEKTMANVNSIKIKSLLDKNISIKFDTVPTPSQDGTNTNTINNNINISIEDNKISSEDINNYFDNVYKIYPRKVSKVQAKETFEHKLRGLNKEDAHKQAIVIYKMLEKQVGIWCNENNGEGRKMEHIPHMSTWLNDNVENSPFFKRGRK